MAGFLYDERIYEYSESNCSSVAPGTEKGMIDFTSSNDEGGFGATNHSSSQNSALRFGPTVVVDDEDSSGSEQSDEEMAQVQSEAEKQPDFNPKMYYWLFNPQLAFSKRREFQVSEDISSKDFMDMRRVNRQELTEFFKVQIPEKIRQRKSRAIPKFSIGLESP